MRLSLVGDKGSLVTMDPDASFDSFDDDDDLKFDTTTNDYTSYFDNTSYPDVNGSSGVEEKGCMNGEVLVYESVLFGTTLAVPEWEALLTAFALTLIILLTLVGNVLVILSVFTYKPLRIVQNFFIVSLAVADLTVALLVLPFNVAYSLIGRWEFGITLCKMWLTCDVLCCTASILHLCAIALDRYWAITDPLAYAQKRTLRRVMLMIGGVWLASGAISSPPLAGWNDWPEEFTNNTACRLTQQHGYIVYSSRRRRQWEEEEEERKREGQGRHWEEVEERKQGGAEQRGGQGAVGEGQLRDGRVRGERGGCGGRGRRSRRSAGGVCGGRGGEAGGEGGGEGGVLVSVRSAGQEADWLLRPSVPVHRGEAEDIAVEGEEGCEDLGGHHGVIRGLLVALLPNVRHRAILPVLLPPREAGQLHHLAGVHQLSSQSYNIHDIQSGLQEGFQKTLALETLINSDSLILL